MQKFVQFVVRDELGIVRCLTSEFRFAQHFADILFRDGHTPTITLERE